MPDPNAPPPLQGQGPLMDPEVRKRVMGQDMQIAQELPQNIPKQAGPAGNNPFLSKYSVTSSGYTPEERASRTANEIQFKELLAQQQVGLDKQNQSISDIKSGARNDWVVPAAGLLDEIYGGNSRATATQWAGLSPEERAAKIADMEQGMNQQRASMSGQVKSLIDSKNSMKMAEMQDKNTRFQQGQDMRINMAFNRDVQSANKTAIETMAQVQPIERALEIDADGNVDYGRVTQALSLASRLMGEKGVLTDQDIDRVQRRTIDTHVANIQSWISNNPSQKIPAQIVAPLRQAIEDGKRSMQLLTQSRLQALQNAYVQGYGMRPEVGQTVVQGVYMPMLQQGFGADAQGNPIQPQAAAPAPTQMAAPGKVSWPTDGSIKSRADAVNHFKRSSGKDY